MVSGQETRLDPDERSLPKERGEGGSANTAQGAQEKFVILRQFPRHCLVNLERRREMKAINCPASQAAVKAALTMEEIWPASTASLFMTLGEKCVTPVAQTSSLHPEDLK